MKSCLTCAAVLLLTLSALAADPAVDKQALKPAEYLVGEMHVQDLPAVTYIYGSSQTTFDKMMDLVNKYIPLLTKGIEDGTIRAKGPAMFIYKGVQEDMSKPFTLEIGWCVADDAKDVGELKVRKLPAAKYATMLYTGSTANASKIYEKLMPAIAKAGLTPAGDVREMYIYWERPDSLNNVIQVQVELK
jgi:effector-binding domain-containing protein